MKWFSVYDIIMQESYKSYIKYFSNILYNFTNCNYYDQSGVEGMNGAIKQ